MLHGRLRTCKGADLMGLEVPGLTGRASRRTYKVSWSTEVAGDYQITVTVRKPPGLCCA